jgi:lysophospholipase L1-like esterase
MTGIGVQTWGFNTGEALVIGQAKLGCPLMRGGEVEYPDYTGRLARGSVHDGCDWSATWPGFLDAHPVDVAVLQFGPWDVSNRRFEGDSEWRHPGDAVFDEHLRAEMTAATKLFTDRHIPVVWLESPKVELGRAQLPRPDAPIPTNDPDRMTRFNAVMTDVVEHAPGAALIPLAEWLAQQDGGEMSDTFRPDGVHFTPEAAAVVAEWLGPAIMRAAADARGQL